MRIFISLLLLFLGQFCFAQEDSDNKGFVIGGSLNFIAQNNTYPSSLLGVSGTGGGIVVIGDSEDESRSTSFSFSPYAGKELNAHWMAGVSLRWRTWKYEFEEVLIFPMPTTRPVERNTNSIGFGLLARYTINPDRALNFFLQPQVSYVILNEKIERDGEIDEEEKANYFSLGANLGALYNINERWRVFAQLGGLSYINGSWEIEDSERGQDFNRFLTNFNLANIFFGLELRL